jgi:hypothetical protein
VMIVRPANLHDTCRFGAAGEAIAHHWMIQHYWRRGLRVTLKCCGACGAFSLAGHGGHRAFLDRALEDFLAVPAWPAYGSFEQPGSEHLRERLPGKRSAAA